MANFGTYEGHRIMSQAMDTSLKNQIAKDRLEMDKEAFAADSALKKMQTEEIRDKIARDKVERRREDIKSGYITDYLTNPEIGTDAFSQANLQKYDTEGILKSKDYIDIENELVTVAKNNLANSRYHYHGLSDSEKQAWLKMNKKKIDKERHMTGNWDPNVSNEEYFNMDTTSPLISAYKLADTVGGTQTFSSDDWGGSINVTTNTSAGSTDQEIAQTYLDAVVANKNKNKENLQETDNVEIIQQPDGSFKLIEDDFDFGTGWGDDEYSVRIENGVPQINLKKGGKDNWVDLNKADF